MKPTIAIASAIRRMAVVTVLAVGILATSGFIALYTMFAQLETSSHIMLHAGQERQLLIQTGQLMRDQSPPDLTSARDARDQLRAVLTELGRVRQAPSGNALSRRAAAMLPWSLDVRLTNVIAAMNDVMAANEQGNAPPPELLAAIDLDRDNLITALSDLPLAVENDELAIINRLRLVLMGALAAIVTGLALGWQFVFRPMERRLTSKEETLSAVTFNMADGIITIDDHGIIESANRAAEQMFGWAAAEMVGRNINMLVPAPEHHHHDGYLRHYQDTGIGKIIGIGPREVTAVHKDGRRVPVELAVAEMWAGGQRHFIGAVRDITMRKQAEAVQRELQTRLRLVADSLPVMLFQADRDGRFQLVNRICEQWYGLTRCQMLEQSIDDVPGTDFNRLWRELGVRALAGEAVAKESTLTTFDGKARDVRILLTPQVAEDGGVTGCIGLVEDITAIKATSAQLYRAQKMEAIGQLTGGIAHDFNNLLGIVIGNLDLLRDRLTANPDSLKLTDAALEAALRGADLNRRLLAFARRQALRPEVIDVNATLSGMVRLLQRSLGEQTTVELQCGEELWPIEVDPAQLEAAILNLGVNARDAMPAGGTLTLRTANIGLDQAFVSENPEAVPGDYVLISISDQGCGIPPDILAHVFEPFFTTKEMGKGTGLGLSMVHGFVKQSGGHIGIASESGQGTSVKLYLPRTDQAVKPVGTDDKKMAVVGGEGQTVLVVEDNEDLRRVTSRQLTDLGYRVREADSAAAALVVLAEGGRIDLVFSDVVMPGTMDGLGLAETLARDRPAVRILLTSGFIEGGMLEGRRSALPPGIGLLMKPYRKQALADAVRKVLEGGSGS